MWRENNDRKQDGSQEMKITFRMWLLIAVVVLSLISILGIPPQALQKGLLVKSVDQNSTVFHDGLRKGMIIQSINGKTISSLSDYTVLMGKVRNLKENQTVKMIIKTDNKEIINLYTKKIIKDISLENIPLTKIKTGLDLNGAPVHL